MPNQSCKVDAHFRTTAPIFIYQTGTSIYKELRSAIGGKSPFEMSVEDGSCLVPSFFSFKMFLRIASAPSFRFDFRACSSGLVPNAPKISVILSGLRAGLEAVKQHFLCFLPLPHGQGSFLPILATYIIVLPHYPAA